MLFWPLKWQCEMLSQYVKNSTTHVLSSPQVVLECGLELDEDKYVCKFKPFLINVIFQWCNGSSFFEICKKTDISEGNLFTSPYFLFCPCVNTISSTRCLCTLAFSKVKVKSSMVRSPLEENLLPPSVRSIISYLQKC